MGLKEVSAAVLAERGAAAVRARRAALHTGRGRRLGEELMPGAYPPPTPPTVAFTAYLRGTTTVPFQRYAVETFTWLVADQARKASAASPLVSIVSVGAAFNGVNVRTRVTLRYVEDAAADRLVYRLTVRPGADAPWLDQYWPGSRVFDVAR